CGTANRAAPSAACPRRGSRTQSASDGEEGKSLPWEIALLRSGSQGKSLLQRRGHSGSRSPRRGQAAREGLGIAGRTAAAPPRLGRADRANRVSLLSDLTSAPVCLQSPADAAQGANDPPKSCADARGTTRGHRRAPLVPA